MSDQISNQPNDVIVAASPAPIHPNRFRIGRFLASFAMSMIGGIIGAILLIAAIGFLISVVQAQDQRDALSCARDAITAIGTTWNIEEFKKRASAQALQAINDRPEEVPGVLMAGSDRLGALKECGEPVGQVYRKGISDGKRTSMGDYTSQVTFEKGVRAVRVEVVQENRVWKINWMNMSAPLVPMSIY